ncbi:MAG: competence protein, partial [Bacteroidales bacterium]|nr:competence protein [Bacteroidales bacterium]
VKSSPDAKSVDKFLLHEGTLLTIDDKQDQWWQITIDDGKNGWINYGAEII